MSNKPTSFALYHKHLCPYCVATRKVINELEMDIELRDIAFNASNRKELISEGGKRQVPCLRIKHSDGSVDWLYESGDIMHYLREQHAQANAS